MKKQRQKGLKKAVPFLIGKPIKALAMPAESEKKPPYHYIDSNKT